jgi:hypothetical protein
MLFLPLLFWILVAGVILYGVTRLPGIDPAMVAIARTIVIVIVCLYVLWFLYGLISGAPVLPPLGRHR